MSDDPFLRGRLTLRRSGRTVRYLAPHSVFASHAIDHGTLLLLDHLPPGEPASFLDLGSGYGVLGLEIAARFPRARGLLVDRDLLAVEFSKRNAELLGGSSVQVAPSLGYRDLPPGSAPFDWILSNVPARAGERVLGAFISGGLARLRPGGEMRIVVIAPLSPSVERAAADAGIGFRLAARSQSHSVYSFPTVGAGAPRTVRDFGGGEEVYERDCVRLALPEDLRLVRPSDLADEPGRLQAAIPLLAEHLPALSGARVLVFRAGYGLLPALALARCPDSTVTAMDRDLLASAFVEKNCRESGAGLRVEERLRISDPPPLGPFDLVLGELSPPLGPRATLVELGEARDALAPGGRGLVLALAKQWKEFLDSASASLGIRVLARRDPAVLLELRARTP